VVPSSCVPLLGDGLHHLLPRYTHTLPPPAELDVRKTTVVIGQWISQARGLCQSSKAIPCWSLEGASLRGRSLARPKTDRQNRGRRIFASCENPGLMIKLGANSTSATSWSLILDNTQWLGVAPLIKFDGGRGWAVSVSWGKQT